MNIQQLIKEKGMSKYSLSKASGVPWSTLSDIFSGKTDLNRCSVKTLSKLSKVLEMPIEEIIELEIETKDDIDARKPRDKSYLETNLSGTLDGALRAYIQGEKEGVLHLDCLWNELYGSINADLWAGYITEEQANYLRKEYLYGETQEDLDD
ncbi:helix-turn-helix domain-containing protein [Dehalobacterium formicoaceticum]|uniref:Helix-turn-helix domain-containing protein n=1 Tax=Dehalobacterium formicoaceticum TaxID=51515 RepID=A0ABT1Y5B7_9FIRM|nr:helix-turn-helix transcriptional regulator [Dehalobacterium formicoaceticum]MCR6546066.1 helix-turn-helix domain-containing protein [Dehalobacterium formicoaceticum]